MADFLSPENFFIIIAVPTKAALQLAQLYLTDTAKDYLLRVFNQPLFNIHHTWEKSLRQLSTLLLKRLQHRRP
jgi:hypothetical protein